jgi:phosphatidylglycerophosphate synthase
MVDTLFGMRAKYILIQSITLMRSIASLAFVSVALIQEYAFISLSLYLVALASDLVDGTLARNWNLTSRIGATFDGFADKCITAASLLFAIAIGMPATPCLFVLTRDLFVLSFRYINVDGKQLLTPKRWLGALTAAPTRVLTIVLLLSRMNYQLPVGDLTWYYWLLGCWSISSLVFSIWLDRDRIRRAFNE